MNTDALSAILNDPEAMKKITAIASELSAPAKSAAPAAESQPDPSAELLQRAVPLLSSIAKSGQHAADPNRLRLLAALKPFVSGATASELDHAARLLSVAHMARTAAVQILSSNPSASKEV